jgi:putative transposase
MANDAPPRKSFMEFGVPYFYTATILSWHRLLAQDKYKQIITDCLHYLTKEGLISVYAFVIMPNHIHLIWEMHKENGKEKPNASLLKFTAHAFEKDLKKHHLQVLPYFQVDKSDRKLQFWQLDSLAIALDGREMCEQKLDYIHLNPLHERWNLAKRPEEYPWSSASFYEFGRDNFGFLKHYMDRF